MGAEDTTASLPGGELGHEARAGSGDHAALRLWLRLLACTTGIERTIRTQLREQFGITLARFDYLAQLDRHPEGLRMGALSQYLMVTGGNVTALTDELEREGLVERRASPVDRRACLVALTQQGREEFGRMADTHERWVVEQFASLTAAESRQLFEVLGRLRATQVGQSAGGRSS